MKAILAAIVLTMGLLSPAFADQNGQGQNQDGQGQNQNGSIIRGAPAPLIGAGLPGLAIGIGYGVYWVVRRRRNVG
jgi:hypothetical protein